MRRAGRSVSAAVMTRADAVVEAAEAFLEALTPILRERCTGEDQPLELRGFTQWVPERKDVPGMRFYRATSTWLTAEQQCAVRVLGELRESGMDELSRLDDALANDPVIGPRTKADSVTSFAAGGGAMQAAGVVVPLVDEAVREADGFDFEPAARGELARRWAGMLRRRSDRVTHVLVLYEFDTNAAPIVVEPNLEIDELREDEIAAALLLGGGGPRGLSPQERTVHKTSCIRRSFDSQLFIDGIPEREAANEQRIREEAESRAALLLSALRLFKGGRVTSSGFFQYVGSWTGGASPVQGRFGPMFGWHPGQPYVLTADEVAAFLEFWAHFDAARGSKVIASAVRRFEFAADRSQPEDEIVDLMIAAESLFLTEESKSEMGYRLSTRVALLVGTSLEERMKLSAFMRKAYNARSVIVHGRSPAAKDLVGLEGERITIDLFADELEDLMHRALQIAIRTVADGRPFPPNWEEVMFALPQSTPGHDAE